MMSMFTACYNTPDGKPLPPPDGQHYHYEDFEADTKDSTLQWATDHCPDGMELTEIILQDMGSHSIWGKNIGWIEDVAGLTFSPEK